jgi:D-3-phosphoglycerate dehydrogenase
LNNRLSILWAETRGPEHAALEALYCALRDGRIGGAALDVFREEPLPRSSPFRDLDNVLLTPHIAGGSDALLEGGIDALFASFLALARGPAIVPIL